MAANQIEKIESEIVKLRMKLAKLKELEELQLRVVELEMKVGLSGMEAMPIILDEIEKWSGVTRARILSRRRDEEYVSRPRQVAYLLVRELTGEKFNAIGNAFCSRDHGTIIHGIRSVRDKMDSDQTFAAEVSDIKRRCADRLSRKKESLE